MIDARHQVTARRCGTPGRGLASLHDQAVTGCWPHSPGEPLDRPPVSFWGHVYHRESSAAELVAHTLERWRRYRWDWVKLNPRKHYHVEPWGVRYRYTGVPNAKPTVEHWPVHEPADWDRIDEQPHDQGALGEQLEAACASCVARCQTKFRCSKPCSRRSPSWPS